MREVAVEVALAAVDERVDQLVRDRLDGGRELSHPAGREHAVQQPAVARVLGRVRRVQRVSAHPAPLGQQALAQRGSLRLQPFVGVRVVRERVGVPEHGSHVVERGDEHEAGLRHAIHRAVRMQLLIERVRAPLNVGIHQAERDFGMTSVGHRPRASDR